MKICFSILVYLLLVSNSAFGYWSDDSDEIKRLISACPECGSDQDGKLTPSEVWLGRTKAKKAGNEAWKLAEKLIQESYVPEPLDKGKQYGPAPGKKIKLFILSGQSNMVGQGLSVELTKKQLKTDDRILMFEEGRWQPLRPLEITFGPELSFARTMAATWPGETIGIVKQSEGGTGVLAWHPQWTKEKADLTGDGRKGNLWLALTGKVQAAREAADCEVMGFIWMQGAKDMQTLETGTTYLKNLGALVTGLRKVTGSPRLPFVLGSYRIPAIPDDPHEFDFSSLSENVRPGYGHVLMAQYDAQITLAPARMIPLRDVESYPKNIHFNTKGQFQLGKLFAEGYLDLIGPKE